MQSFFKKRTEKRKTLVVCQVNDYKSMHIGHLRNACIGDTLVRMLRQTGATVEVHNYVDDLGNQLADTVVGLNHVALSGNHVRSATTAGIFMQRSTRNTRVMPGC